MEDYVKSYAFWNNKGGTGKTSLSFQAICAYADKNQDQQVLAIDVCPQANLSELMLGGLTGEGSHHLLERQGLTPRCTIGGYFQSRLPAPYLPPVFVPNDFLTRPDEYNEQVPSNIVLVCGDPLLELQANAINTLANTQIPGTNTWIGIIDWIKTFTELLEDKYDVLFIDANPSFSIYTQIAISTANFLVLPVMADDSSRRAIQNAFSLIYGLKLPSEIYSEHSFAKKLHEAGRALPRIHTIAKNRITQYMGPASAYAAVLRTIDADIKALMETNPELFSFLTTNDGIVSVRDFQTTGVVAFARGCPFFTLRAGKRDIGGHRVQVNEEQRLLCVEAINDLVNRLEKAT